MKLKRSDPRNPEVIDAVVAMIREVTPWHSSATDRVAPKRRILPACPAAAGSRKSAPERNRTLLPSERLAFLLNRIPRARRHQPNDDSQCTLPHILSRLVGTMVDYVA